MASAPQTRSFAGPGETPSVSCLFLNLALAGGRPGAIVARFPLTGITRVEIGRGEHTGSSRLPDDGGVLRIQIADAWMSGAHAVLALGAGGWIACDQSSKNGTFVDGRPVVSEVPVSDGTVIEVGSSFLVARQVDAQPAELRDTVATSPESDSTLSIELERLYAQADAVAESDVPVVIGGRSGTGKERLARRVHRGSNRKGRFVGVNCGALAANLVESSLFGHRKGAFSGATSDQPGLFRSADGGTLLLDELAELPTEAQVKLLRVLQEREVMPVGDTRPVAVDVRVIAASHRDLARAVDSGQLREDLQMRLWGLELVLPALVDRLEDLGLLCAAIAKSRLKAMPQLSRECWRALFCYSWPGNIRELEQVLMTAAELAGTEVRVEHLPARFRDLATPVPDPADELPERLQALLRQHRGNVSAVARELGKARVQVRRWCQRFGIDIDSYR